MKITLLKIENFQCIDRVEIEPGDRSLVLIAGNNRQGKSSLLRAMSAALGGGKGKPDRPVRDGEEVAEIVIELDNGDLVVTKRFSDSGKVSLEVKGKLGRIASPQRILDGIVGTRFLDPLAFTRLTARHQRAKLLEIVDIGIDLDENASQRKAVFAERTEANRDVKRLISERGAFEDPGEIPAKKDLEELLFELDALRSQESKAENAKRALGRLNRNISVAASAVEKVEASLSLARSDLDLHVEMLNSDQGKLLDIANVDVTEAIAVIREELAQVDSHNANVTCMQSNKEAIDQVDVALLDARESAADFNAQVNALDKEKSDALAIAKMPVDGLGLGESDVLLNGIPLSQASGAEQLQLSLAIAASTSPELRDIWIEDGALLDSESLELVSAFAKENDLRVWLERVGELDDDCIIMEEGAIRERQ